MDLDNSRMAPTIPQSRLLTSVCHTLYVKSDGKWAMGKNDNARLEDGTVENKNSRSAVKAYVMTIGVEADGNGTASGGGQFAYGQTGSFLPVPIRIYRTAPGMDHCLVTPPLDRLQ